MMKKILIPLVLLLLGTALGTGAGVLLTNPAPADHANQAEHADDHDDHGHTPAKSADHHDTAEAGHDGPDYVKMQGQFIVPILKDGAVRSMVIMSLGLETSAGDREQVLHLAPRFRDAFIDALFNHSSLGGLDGDFTSRKWRNAVRSILKAEADAIAPGQVINVLILEINRQDL